MIISVAAGKGGTGKTTIATNMALALGGRVGCLIATSKSPTPISFKTSDRADPRGGNAHPLVDESKCTFCKKCSRTSAASTPWRWWARVLVFAELCHSCGGCMLVCP